MSAVLIIGAVIAAIGLWFTIGRQNNKYKYPPSPPGYNFFKGGHAYLIPKDLEVSLPLLGRRNNFLRLVRFFQVGPRISEICSPYTWVAWSGCFWIRIRLARISWKRGVLSTLLDRNFRWRRISFQRETVLFWWSITRDGVHWERYFLWSHFYLLSQIMHQLLTAKQADTYRPFQDLESKKLIYDILQSPSQFYLHIRRYSNSGSIF